MCRNMYPIPQMWHPETSFCYENSKFGQRLSSNQEVSVTVDGYFTEIPTKHYRDGIMTLEYR